MDQLCTECGLPLSDEEIQMGQEICYECSANEQEEAEWPDLI